MYKIFIFNVYNDIFYCIDIHNNLERYKKRNTTQFKIELKIGFNIL